MPLLAYTLTAAVLLWLAHRFVLPLSRRAAVLLFLIPFAFCGVALLTNRVYAPVDLPCKYEPDTNGGRKAAVRLLPSFITPSAPAALAVRSRGLLRPTAAARRV